MNPGGRRPPSSVAAHRLHRRPLPAGLRRTIRSAWLCAVLSAALAVTSATAETLFIPAANSADMAHDQLRQLLYISAGDSVLRFDMTTRQMLAPFRLGGQLAGIDISPDGRWLAVADLTFDVARPQGRTSGWFHLVDLTTGGAERVAVPPVSIYNEQGTYSVAFAADGLVYVTTGPFGQYGYLRSYDPRSRALRVIPIGFTGAIVNRTMLTTSRDKTILLFGQAAISDGSWGALSVFDGRVLFRQGPDGAGFFITGAALSRDNTQVVTYGYDLTSFDIPSFVKTTRFRATTLITAAGAVYHPFRDLLYLTITGYRDILIVDSRTFREIGRYATPLHFPWTPTSAHAPGRLKTSADGRWLFAVLPNGIGGVTTE